MVADWQKKMLDTEVSLHDIQAVVEVILHWIIGLMMPKVQPPNRKRFFRAALALAGTNARAWAASQGITATWLSMVLNGKGISVRLTKKIDLFIAEHLDTARAKAS